MTGMSIEEEVKNGWDGKEKWEVSCQAESWKQVDSAGSAGEQQVAALLWQIQLQDEGRQGESLRPGCGQAPPLFP